MIIAIGPRNVKQFFKSHQRSGQNEQDKQGRQQVVEIEQGKTFVADAPEQRQKGRQVRDWTTIWVFAFLGIALGYGFLPDWIKYEYYYDLVQWHAVPLAAAGYSAISFRHSLAKGGMLVALAYCVCVAVVDRWLPEIPILAYVGTAGVFLGWLGFWKWRSADLESYEEPEVDKGAIYGDDDGDHADERGDRE